MGTELRRMIRDGAPPGWTSLMRDVAKEIADDARDPSLGLPADGGLPWSALPVEGRFDDRGRWREGLTERCGVTARAISAALTALARAGYEMREQIGTDRHGQPVFAHKGRAMRFRVPRLLPRPVPASAEMDERSHDGAGFDDERAHGSAEADGQRPHGDAGFGSQRSHADAPKVARGCDPISSESPQAVLSTQDEYTAVAARAAGAAPGAAPVAFAYRSLAEDLIAELCADGDESGVINNMAVERGANRKAIVNKITFDRYGIPKRDRVCGECRGRGHTWEDRECPPF